MPRKSVTKWLQDVIINRNRAKARVFLLLGNFCNECGLSDQRILQLDHIKRYRGPRSHSHRSGYGLIYAILSGKVSWLSIQLLCANCHAIKKFENDEYRDPPYGLEFMGKEWDSFSEPGIGERATEWPSFTPNSANPTCALCGGRQRGAKKCYCPMPEWKPIKSLNPSYGKTQNEQILIFQKTVSRWGEALLPLLYPGALVFMFGGTRMWHRLACGMEDAGFEIFDTLMFMHGQGFPKAQAIDALIDKRNGDKRPVVGEREFHGNAATSTKEKGGTYVTGASNTPSAQYPVTGSASEQSVPWSGHKTAALKPAWEPVLCFRAPDKGKTYAELAMEFGSGALNVDAGRIGVAKEIPASPSKHADERCHGKYGAEDGTADGHNPNIGRYPANLAFECICEKVEIVNSPATGHFPEKRGESAMYGGGDGLPRETGRPEDYVYGGKAIRHTNPNCPAFLLDAQAGETTSTGGRSDNALRSDQRIFGKGVSNPQAIDPGFGDTGGPSRFFYTAKASRSEREEGLNGFEKQRGGVHDDDAFREAGERKANHTAPGLVANDHPTVKPIDLCRWLASLLLPPDSITPRRMLVPFSGSGSEVIGALLAGWDEVTGIEQDQHYCEIAQARIAHWSREPAILRTMDGVETVRHPEQGSLFGQ